MPFKNNFGESGFYMMNDGSYVKMHDINDISEFVDDSNYEDRNTIKTTALTCKAIMNFYMPRKDRIAFNRFVWCWKSKGHIRKRVLMKLLEGIEKKIMKGMNI